MKAYQSGLYTLSLILLNVRNTRRHLPKDLIILLISNYFKDKWVHLASKQICQWWTRETVPSSLLSLEINGLTIKIYIYIFHIPTRLRFKKDFLFITAIFLSFTVTRRVSCYLPCPVICGWHWKRIFPVFLTCIQAFLWLSYLGLFYNVQLWFGTQPLNKQTQNSTWLKPIQVWSILINIQDKFSHTAYETKLHQRASELSVKWIRRSKWKWEDRFLNESPTFWHKVTEFEVFL